MNKKIKEYLERKCLGETKIRAVIDLQIKFYLSREEAETIYDFWRRNWCDITKKGELA